MTQHSYDNPIQYSLNNSLQYEIGLSFLNKLLIKNTARVLDLGCGDGAITKEIASLANEGMVVGTDISKQMIDFASHKYHAQTNLSFLKMDASKNIFQNQFDVITSFNCLHWVDDQKGALKGILNAAAPDAQIALLLSHKRSDYHHMLDKLCTSLKWRRYFNNFINPRLFFSKTDYEQLVKKSGLCLKNIQEKEIAYRFESKTQLKAFFSAAGAQIKLIPAERKEEFLDDFIDGMFQSLKCSEQNISVVFWYLEVLAIKPKNLGAF